MTRHDLISKFAESWYLKRVREASDEEKQKFAADPKWWAERDWAHAIRAVKFFEKSPKNGDWWWEKEYEDFKFFEPLWSTLTGKNNDRAVT